MLECCCGEDGWRGAGWVMLGSLEKASTFFIAWNLGKRECFLFRPKSSVEVAKFTLAPKIAQKWMLWCFLLYRNSFISLSGSCSSLRHVCVTPAQQGSLPGVPGIHGQQKAPLRDSNYSVNSIFSLWCLWGAIWASCKSTLHYGSVGMNAVWAGCSISIPGAAPFSPAGPLSR